MAENRISIEWEQLFKAAEEQFSKFRQLSEISQIWAKCYEQYEIASYRQPRVITDTRFEIRDLPQLI